MFFVVFLFNVLGSMFGFWLRVRHSGGWPSSRHGGGTATAGGCAEDSHLAPNPGNSDKIQQDQYTPGFEKRDKKIQILFTLCGAGPARMQVWLRDRNCGIKGSLHCWEELCEGQEEILICTRKISRVLSISTADFVVEQILWSTHSSQIWSFSAPQNFDLSTKPQKMTYTW